jgi:hypothetical protein
MLKPDLYQLLKRSKPVHRTYRVGSILAEHCHTVLLLPMCHPRHNPIELIWTTVKNCVTEKNVTSKLGDVFKLTDMSFATITNEDWQKEGVRMCKTLKPST